MGGTKWARRGKLHGNTKPGKPHSDYNWWKCLERDGLKCQRCGTTVGLDVHHIDGKSLSLAGDNTNNELDNLQTLCHKCHLKLHYGTSERNQYIVRQHDKGETLESIAQSLGLTRQRVHQIYQKAFSDPILSIRIIDKLPENDAVG